MSAGKHRGHFKGLYRKFITDLCDSSLGDAQLVFRFKPRETKHSFCTCGPYLWWSSTDRSELQIVDLMTGGAKFTRTVTDCPSGRSLALCSAQLPDGSYKMVVPDIVPEAMELTLLIWDPDGSNFKKQVVKLERNTARVSFDYARFCRGLLLIKLTDRLLLYDWRRPGESMQLSDGNIYGASSQLLEYTSPNHPKYIVFVEERGNLTYFIYNSVTKGLKKTHTSHASSSDNNSSTSGGDFHLRRLSDSSCFLVAFQRKPVVVTQMPISVKPPFVALTRSIVKADRNYFLIRPDPLTHKLEVKQIYPTIESILTSNSNFIATCGRVVDKNGIWKRIYTPKANQ